MYNPRRARGDQIDTEPSTAWIRRAGIQDKDDSVQRNAGVFLLNREATGTPTHRLTPSHPHPATLHAGPCAGQSNLSNISRGPPPPGSFPTNGVGISTERGRRAPPAISVITHDVPNFTVTRNTRSNSKPQMLLISLFWPRATSGMGKIPFTGNPSMGPKTSGYLVASAWEGTTGRPVTPHVASSKGGEWKLGSNAISARSPNVRGPNGPYRTPMLVDVAGQKVGLI